MKKYYFTITSILVLAIWITSCSNEDNKTKNNTASRPTVLVIANEVRIGNQIWMTKNLNVSRYRNGDPIPQVTDPTQWANLTTGAWCYYNNDPANGPIYGKLYNWYAVNDPRGLSPQGYHVPSEDDWFELTTFLGGINVSGTKMKSTILWDIPNISTNSSNFSGLPAGYCNYNGLFKNISKDACWWSSTTGFGPNNALYLFVVYNSSQALTTWNDKKMGYTVRCLKN
jgi:uncharacterized protein (TIGR02145 family)